MRQHLHLSCVQPNSYIEISTPSGIEPKTGTVTVVALRVPAESFGGAFVAASCPLSLWFDPQCGNKIAYFWWEVQLLGFEPWSFALASD
eukprot:5327940-Prymnesium_polylepis.1